MLLLSSFVVAAEACTARSRRATARLRSLLLVVVWVVRALCDLFLSSASSFSSVVLRFANRV